VLHDGARKVEEGPDEVRRVGLGQAPADVVHLGGGGAKVCACVGVHGHEAAQDKEKGHEGLGHLLIIDETCWCERNVIVNYKEFRANSRCIQGVQDTVTGVH